MRIERKLVLRKGHCFYHSNDNTISFCRNTFREYVAIGQRKVIFLIASNRKPRHNQSFKLKYEDRYWRLDSSDMMTEWSISPWLGGFDRFLSKKFRTTGPVYVWIEYE